MFRRLACCGLNWWCLCGTAKNDPWSHITGMLGTSICNEHEGRFDHDFVHLQHPTKYRLSAGIVDINVRPTIHWKGCGLHCSSFNKIWDALMVPFLKPLCPFFAEIIQLVEKMTNTIWKAHRIYFSIVHTSSSTHNPCPLFYRSPACHNPYQFTGERPVGDNF